MPEAILETFLQVSDLHIGDFDVNGSAVVHTGWAKCRLFEGFLGHHFRALRALDHFYQQLRRQENAKLVVVGDLTSCGSVPQFHDAAMYLAGCLPPAKTGVGLQAPNWSAAAIPGNHDHWPGSNQVSGPPTPALGTTFPTMPYVTTMAPLSNGYKLSFAFLNSDADVSPTGFRRWFALGDFQTQLHQLDAVLQNPLPNETRVLVLHHSPNYGPTRRSKFQRLRIMKNSWDALNQFIVNHRFKVLMTGHIHVDHLALGHLPDSLGKGKYPYLECRSGPATVRDDIPSNWRNLWGQFPAWRPRPNGVIVHRIVRKDNGTTVWRAEIFRRTPNSFARLNPPVLEEIAL